MYGFHYYLNLASFHEDKMQLMPSFGSLATLPPLGRQPDPFGGAALIYSLFRWGISYHPDGYQIFKERVG
jgi:hypothetical protein